MDVKSIAVGVGAAVIVGGGMAALVATARRNGEDRRTPAEAFDHDTMAKQYVDAWDADSNGSISFGSEALKFGDGGIKVGETYVSLRPLVLAADMALGNRDGEANQAEIAALVRSFDPTPDTPMSRNEAIVFSDEFGSNSGFGGSIDEMRPFS